jgi:hypothetical protein
MSIRYDFKLGVYVAIGSDGTVVAVQNLQTHSTYSAFVAHATALVEGGA